MACTTQQIVGATDASIRLLRKSSGESWCRGGMRTKYLHKAEGHAEACISLMWELGLCL